MLGIAGIGVFFAVGLVVSMRLLDLARHSRRLPELLAGLGLLGIGPLGFCVMMAGPMLFGGTPLAPVCRVTGMGLQALGFVASAVFTWRVFRPGSRWARGFTTAICVSLLLTFAACALAPNRGGAMRLHHHLDVFLKIACLVWGALESLRYWRVTQRRVALGLADPLVSASFLAWGISLGAGALGFALIWAALLALVPGEHLSAGIELALSLCGVIAAAGLYLAFLPPRAYARRLAARASRTDGRRLMADSAVFEFVASELERSTNLGRPAARAAVRGVLEQALFDPRWVSARQMLLLIERLLPSRAPGATASRTRNGSASSSRRRSRPRASRQTIPSRRTRSSAG